MSRSLKQPSVLPEALEAVTGIAQCDHSSPLGADAKAVIAAAVSHFGAQWTLHDRQITQRGHMVKRYTWQAENMSGKSAKQLMFRANERGLLPEKIVASVMKVYQARQATLGTPGHRIRSRSKKESTGSSGKKQITDSGGSKKQSTGSSKKQSTGSSKRPAGVEADAPGVRSSSSKQQQGKGTKRQRVEPGSTSGDSASKGSGAESADDAPASSSDMANGSHQVSLHAQQESDLQQQGGTKPSSTQQQQQQQGNVKQEQPSAKQQHSDKGMNRPSTANNPELAPPPSQQAAGPASGKLQVQVQADSKQQQQQVKGKQQPKREPMGIAAARAWLAKARDEFAELQKLLAVSVDSKPQQAATAAAGAGTRQHQQ